jgi:hypothetical protein
MNRQQRRLNVANNLREVKHKRKAVAKIQVNKFQKLAAYIIANYDESEGVPDSEIQELVENKHPNPEFQKLFNEYREAKKAAIVLSMMRKELKENGIGEKSVTKQEVLGVNVSEAVSS